VPDQITFSLFKNNFMKKLFFTIAVCCTASIAYCQMIYAPLMPKTFRSQDNAFATIPGAYVAPHHITNGVYDELGNIIFYTFDEYVLDANSNPANNDLTGFNDDITDEVIVPKPGSCNEYYVIYVNYQNPLQTALRYCLVTVSGGNITVAPYVNLILENNHHGSIAVSKRLTNGDRYLFYGSPAGIRKLLITSSGISLQALLSSTGVYSYELELNEAATGWKLAWAGATSGNFAGYGNLVNVLPLNTAGNVSGAITTTTIGGTLNSGSRINGLEFLSSTNVFTAISYGTYDPANGIYRTTLGSNTTTLVTGSLTYCWSNLERYAGGFYALGYSPFVGSPGKLGIFNVASVSAVAASPSVSNLSADNYYYIPRGVDGENYYAILRGNEPAVTATWPVSPCPGDVLTATVTNVQAGTTYTWYQKCGTAYTNLGTGTSKLLTIVSGCSYFVRAVSASGCSSVGFPTSNIAQVCPIIGGGGGSSKTAAASPNPSTGIFNISIPGAAAAAKTGGSNVNLKVFNALGTLVLQKNAFAAGTVLLDMQGFANGTYLLHVETNGRLINTQKLVVSK
jgi:hypothetical protein